VGPQQSFLWDVAALEQAEQLVGQPAAPADQAAEPQQHVNSGVDQRLLDGLGARMQHTKLPEFWPHAPGMWFAHAECRFEINGIHSERQKFCCMEDSLPYKTMRLVADFIAAPPVSEPYTLLERLMLVHALTPT
jgi:hypothetical protein